MEQPWEKKKKIADFSIDFDQLEGIVDKLMQQIAPELPANPDKPVVFGFSMRLGADGNPKIEEFGNVKKIGEKAAIAKVREPLVDIQKEEKEILITVELPGVEKKDVKVNVPDEHTVEIIVAGTSSFYKKIPISESLKKEKAKAKFKNGILEISIERLNPEKQSGGIKIE